MENCSYLNVLQSLTSGCKNVKKGKSSMKDDAETAASYAHGKHSFKDRIDKGKRKEKKEGNHSLVEQPLYVQLEGQRRAEEIRHFLNSKGIKVTAENMPEPVITFQECVERYAMTSELVEALQRQGIHDCLPVQMMTLPCMIEGYDVFTSAPTGSGKTLAFLLPVLHRIHLRKQEEKEAKSAHAVNSSTAEPLRALILAPTKELANQIHDEVCSLIARKKADEKTPITARCLTKLSEKRIMKQEAKAQGRRHALIRADILITTPKRLIWMLDRKKPFVHLDSLEWLVLDECDKLFDVGSLQRNRKKSHPGKPQEDDGDSHSSSEDEEEEQGPPAKKAKQTDAHATDSKLAGSFQRQLQIVWRACEGNPNLRMALFSATSHPIVKRWAREHFKRPAFLRVGVENTSVLSVEQRLKFCSDDAGKEWELKHLLGSGGLRPQQYPVLVFVQTKKRAFHLKAELLREGIKTDVISADRSEKEREHIVSQFRSGELPSLLCTELMSRGMDFPNVGTVVNYDLPLTPVEYIHRVGRTGRAFKRGLAITFWSEADKKEVLYGFSGRKEMREMKREQLNTAPLLAIMNVMANSGVPVNEELHNFLKTHRVANMVKKKKCDGSAEGGMDDGNRKSVKRKRVADS